jgi:hypothetical protein
MWRETNYMPASLCNISCRCDVKLHAGILCNISCLRQFLQAVGGQIEFDWGRSWLHVVIQIHTYVTELGGPELYAAYDNYFGFYLPSVARSHFIAADFLLNGPHRVIQFGEDVTRNLVSAFYILRLYQVLAAFGGQISFDGERLSMELIPCTISTNCKHVTGNMFPPCIY